MCIRDRVIPLSGSVELAPLIGLSDFIVDLVQTGRTLKENNLVVIEEIPYNYLDIVITLCDNAKQSCPNLPAKKAYTLGPSRPSKL